MRLFLAGFAVLVTLAASLHLYAGHLQSVHDQSATAKYKQARDARLQAACDSHQSSVLVYKGKHCQ